MGKIKNILPAGEPDPGQGFADRKFDEALRYLVDRGAIPDFIVIRRNSAIDGEGIDRLVPLPGGLMVAIQIKPKRRHHFKKELLHHLKIHPLVVCIFGIEKRESIRRLARRVIRKINKMIRKTNEIRLNNELQVQPPSKAPL